MEELIKKAYKKANFYYYTIFAKAVVFAFLGYYLNKQYPDFFDITENSKTIISTIVFLYLVVSIPLVLWLFSKKVALIATIEDHNLRYKFYMKWVFIRMSLVGVNFVVNAFLPYTMHSTSFLYAAGIGAIAMLFCKPNMNNIEKELNPVVEIE